MATATGVPYSIYAPDNALAKGRSVSIFSRRTVMSMDENKKEPRREGRRDAPRKRPEKNLPPRRPFGQGKRLSLVTVSLDGSVLQPVPENFNLASLEAAALTFPKEMNTAIGRSNNSRSYNSDRRRQLSSSVYSTMTIDSRISDAPRRRSHDTMTSPSATSPRSSSDKRSSRTSTSPRESSPLISSSQNSQLRSKFAPLPPPKDERRVKPVVKLQIPSTNAGTTLKPVYVNQSRELPPVPIEGAQSIVQPVANLDAIAQIPVSLAAETALEQQYEPPMSAVSSLALTIDDSNLILHSSVTSPLVSAISPTNQYRIPDTIHAKIHTKSETSEDDPGVHMTPRIEQIPVDPLMAEAEPAVSSSAKGPLYRPRSILDELKTFYDPVESDNEDEDSDSRGSSGESSLSSYDVPTPVDGQPAPASLQKTVSGTLGLLSSVKPLQIGSEERVRPRPHGRAYSTNFAIQRMSAPELVLRRSSSDSWMRGERILDNRLEAIMANQGTPTTASLTPPLPRRSYMRYWQQSLRARTFSRPQPTRRSTEPASFRDLSSLPSMKRRNSDHFSHNPTELAMMAGKRSPAIVLNIADESINPDVAESVVWHILSALDNFDDLISCALVNHGFYMVMKRNELSLSKKILRNQSNAAWELHETSMMSAKDNKKGSTEESALVFSKAYRKNMRVIDRVRELILSRCTSMLRADTVNALSGRNEPRGRQITDALWRIWTFCLLFGSGKGRESDVVGQMDWMRAGMLAHQATCFSTIVWSDPLDMTSILLNPPDSFGGGNGSGLSIDQIHDMTEMWNCLKVLLSGILGPERVQQAREHGIFSEVSQRGGPCEELLLEEWVYHLTTLGLSAVLDLVDAADSEGPQVFILAKEHGWASWSAPPKGGTRSTFLKEAVKRVYEEKLNRLRQPDADDEFSKQEKRKQYRKLRTAIVAAELKQLKARPDYHKTPISQDRPMSVWSQVRVDRTNGGKQGFATIVEEEVPEEIHPALREQIKRTSRNFSKADSNTLKRSLSKRSTRSSRSARSTRSSDSRRHSGPKCSPVQKKGSPGTQKKALPRKPSKRSSTTSSTSVTSSSKSEPLARTASILSSPFSMTLFPMRQRNNSAAGQRRHSETPPSHYTHPERGHRLPPRPESTSPERGQHRRNAALSCTQSRSTLHEQPQLEQRQYTSEPRASSEPRSRPRRPTPVNRRSYYGVQSIVVGEATHDKALFRIVDMGFPIQDAREALRVTDSGDGISVDRAVTWLLNRQVRPVS